ncbi:MAG: hypothetical protein IJ658_07145 [Kiritimatiellae bacterium]|nr:hypothetical protein [Kiritimatiellia bacterium]
MKRSATMFLAALLGGACYADRPILAINEDNDHYFKLDSSLMTETALADYAYDIFRGPVTHFFMCPQGQRASFDSKAWEPIWAGLDDPDKNGRTNNIWCVNAKLLHDRGIDPYQVWIRCARAKSVSPWMTMRMNDVHFCTTSNYFRNTTFWKTRPDLRCVPEATKGKWEQFCFDYSHTEVRAYHMAMVRELLERYDIDGLELDWLRFAWYFKPGENRRNAHFLTDFVREARACADAIGDRRGRRILLGARVPTLPAACAMHGMDVDAWAGERLIDWLVVCNNHMCADYAIPYLDWRHRLAPLHPGLVILPGTDHKITIGGTALYAGAPASRGTEEYVEPAALRGWAEALIAQGAPGFYLFNLPYNPKDTRDEIYGKGLSPAAVRAGSRRYVASRHDTLPRGGIPSAPLPVAVKGGAFVSIRIGRPPVSGGAVVLGFDSDTADPAALDVQLNGEAPSGPPRELERPKKGNIRRRLSFPFAASAFVPFENGVTVESAGDGDVRLVWCELQAMR